MQHLAPLGHPPQEYWKAITHKGVLIKSNRLKVNNRKSQESTEVGPYHTETCLKICRANQWTGFYMIRTCIILRVK